MTSKPLNLLLPSWILPPWELIISSTIANPNPTPDWFKLLLLSNLKKGLKTFLLENELKDYELFVVHDDIDLGFGRFRIKKSSSDGGHNGIKSIDLAIGNNDYWRFKVGVGRPPSTKDPAEYVLSKFNSDETEEVEFIIEDSMEIIDLFLKDVESAIKTASERRIIDVV